MLRATVHLLGEIATALAVGFSLGAFLVVSIALIAPEQATTAPTEGGTIITNIED